jgi:hypothetical protein
MADLSVDLELLDGFGTKLDVIKQSLDSATSVIDSYDSAYGSDKVRDAMHHFVSHWNDGRKHVEDTAGSLATMVHESVAAYRKSDGDLANKIKDATKGKGK